MKLEPNPPSGWPKEFAFTDNPWFNAWRPRPSDAGRMTACLAWTCLPRDNAFTFAKDGVSQTAEEKLVERKGKTDKGTSDHNLMKVGKLKGQEERFGKFQPEHHEVRLFYDLLTLSPITNQAKFPAAENDAFRKLPDSRRYVFGTTDYLNPETKRTADLKTGKVKEDAIRQTALYAHMAGIDTGNYTLEVWNKRARTDRIYTPADFAQSNESLKLATTKMLERVRTLLLSGDEPEATPGEGGCSFCPSRFFCDSYVDIYLPSVPIKTLRNWLHAELNAYHNQEI